MGDLTAQEHVQIRYNIVNSTILHIYYKRIISFQHIIRILMQYKKKKVSNEKNGKTEYRYIKLISSRLTLYYPHVLWCSHT
jgi:hypothetical protein